MLSFSHTWKNLILTIERSVDFYYGIIAHVLKFLIWLNAMCLVVFKSVEIVFLFVNETIAWYLLCVCRRWSCTRKIPSWIFHLFVFVPLLLSGVYFFSFMHFISRAHELSFCFLFLKG